MFEFRTAESKSCFFCWILSDVLVFVDIVACTHNCVHLKYFALNDNLFVKIVLNFFKALGLFLVHIVTGNEDRFKIVGLRK